MFALINIQWTLTLFGYFFSYLGGNELGIIPALKKFLVAHSQDHWLLFIFIYGKISSSFLLPWHNLLPFPLPLSHEHKLFTRPSLRLKSQVIFCLENIQKTKKPSKSINDKWLLFLSETKRKYYKERMQIYILYVFSAKPICLNPRQKLWCLSLCNLWIFRKRKDSADSQILLFLTEDQPGSEGSSDAELRPHCSGAWSRGEANPPHIRYHHAAPRTKRDTCHFIRAHTRPLESPLSGLHVWRYLHPSSIGSLFLISLWDSPIQHWLPSP